MDLMNSNLDAVVLDEPPAKEIVRQNPNPLRFWMSR